MVQFLDSPYIAFIVKTEVVGLFLNEKVYGIRDVRLQLLNQDQNTCYYQNSGIIDKEKEFVNLF